MPPKANRHKDDITPPIHAGVRFDLSALLSAFKAKNSVRFEAFGQAFAALKMSLIFAGRQTACELVEFEEHLLQLCAAHMMSNKSGEISGYPEMLDPTAKPEVPVYKRSDLPPEHLPVGVLGVVKERETETEKDDEDDELMTSLVERMFGIYSCYAFYYLQPRDYKAQIRVSPAQLRDVMDFVDERLRPQRHLDCMACFYKLLNEGAFRITAFELTYDPACHKRFEAEVEGEACLPLGAENPLERIQAVTEDRTMQQLEILQKRYEEAKRKAGIKGVSHGAIDVMQTAQRILETAKVSIQLEENGGPMMRAGRGGTNGGPASVAFADSSSRLDIKKRAYASAVQASRHRRYAFIDGDETVAFSGAEAEEEAPGTSKKKDPPKKKARPSRKTQREEKADELLEELHALGVDGVVKRRNASPRKSISMDNTDAILNEFIGSSSTRKRINKNEANKIAIDPLVRVTKSKKEEVADREMAKILKAMQEQEKAA